MPNFTLEQDDPVEGNVETKEETKVEETAEGTKEAVGATEGVEATQEKEPQPEETSAEPTIEIDGQQVSLSQAKEALDVLKNQKDWNKKNTQKAMEIADRERQLQEALLIAERAKSHPEVLQSLFAPPQERNFDQELADLYAKRPQDIYSQEYVNWEYYKDKLNAERVQATLLKQSRAEIAQTTAAQMNDSIENSARAKYADKVSQVEFTEMGKWIVQHIRPNANGQFPSTCFDTAYRELFWDKAVTEAKLEAGRSVGKSIFNAKPASGAPGATKRTETKTPEEIDDDDFVEAIKSRH